MSNGRGDKVDALLPTCMLSRSLSQRKVAYGSKPPTRIYVCIDHPAGMDRWVRIRSEVEIESSRVESRTDLSRFFQRMSENAQLVESAASRVWAQIFL